MVSDYNRIIPSKMEAGRDLLAQFVKSVSVDGENIDQVAYYNITDGIVHHWSTESPVLQVRRGHVVVEMDWDAFENDQNAYYETYLGSLHAYPKYRSNKRKWWLLWLA